jgi:heptosyltransferase II
MRSIALFLPNWIGDVVMATPAIRAIRSHFPDAKILGVCKPYVADTLAGSPWLDDLVLFDRSGPRHRRFPSVLARLRSEALDATVLFPNSFRAALLAKLAGSTRIVGYARYLRDPLLTDRLYAKRGMNGHPQPSPILDDYNRLAMKIGVPNPDHTMELFTTANDEAAAERFWLQHGLNRVPRVVGLNPGGAFGASKHWPTQHFVELAQRFCEQRGTTVVVLCGPAERDEAARIVTQTARPNAISMGNADLSIGLTKAIVRRLNLLVTTDSGPRHFAAAFGVPVVTLFGPTHIEWTETQFPNAIHLQKKLPCGPCQQRSCPEGHHRCMTELSPADVYTAATNLLARAAPRLESRNAG